MKTVSIFVVLASMMMASCSSKDGQSPTDPPPPSAKVTRKFILTINLGEGVNSNLSSGDHAYNEGQVVAYEFSPKDGYRNILVQNGDNIVPVSDSITVSSNIKLSAEAEKAIILPEEAKLIEKNIEEFVSSRDSIQVIESYEEHVRGLEQLYATHTTEEARGIIVAAYREAYENSPDEDLNRTEKYLGGHLFTSGGMERPSSDRIRFTRSLSGAVSSEASATMIYVNGIMNTVDAPAGTLIELQKLIDEAGLTGKINLYNFYNPGGRYGQGDYTQCLMRSVATVSRNSWMKCGLLGDIDQSLRQLADILNQTPAEAEPESKSLAKIIKQERADGHPVIMIGHSQGNLVIEQAFDELQSFDQCISAISLAGPLGKTSWQPWTKPNLGGFVVKGNSVIDPILVLGYNDFQSIPTNISRAFDQKIENDSGLETIFKIWDSVSLSFSLHSMLGSYLAGEESRSMIQDMIREQTDMFSSNDLCRIRTGNHLYASSGGSTNSSRNDLWIVPPYPNGVDTLVARIHLSSGEIVSTNDLAFSPQYGLLGISFTNLYKIDPKTALAEEIANFYFFTPNALTFNTTGDLYAVDAWGEVMVIRLDPLRIIWKGNLGEEYDSGGDIVSAPDGRLFATVTDTKGSNLLAILDPNDGHVIKVFPEGLGPDRICGLGFVGKHLFGLSVNPVGIGFLIEIDTNTGEKTFIRKLGFSASGAASDRIQKH